MADTVRGIMEAMVPELEDYVARGYFSNGETSSIIQNRQKFEYCLRRRNADKQDFLRYCEYEWKLEQLRQLRRKAKAIAGKRSLADYGIVRRIHFIYDRATRKFKGDVTIWMSWLQFCRESNSKRQVSKVVTKALKLHPSASHFWAYAAAWEFEGNSNPAAARQLLQSGLRHCPRDSSLWVEYFRMELLYANKLKARRQVLGLDDQDDQETGKNPKTTLGASPADTAILQGKLASVVHKTAVAKLPKMAGMRLGMLRATQEVAIEASDDLQQAIVCSYIEDLGEVRSISVGYESMYTDSDACCKLATIIEQGHATQLGDGLHAACEFLQERIQTTEDAQMQHAAVSWASEHIVALDAQYSVRACPHSGAEQSVWALDSNESREAEQGRAMGGNDEATEEHCEELCEWIVKCADMTVKGGCQENVAASKVQALLRIGQIAHAFDTVKGELKQRSHSVVVWQLALRMSVASAGVKAKPEGENLCGYSSMSKLVSAALKSTEGSPGCEALLPQTVACLAAMQEPLDAALTHMLNSLATASVDSDGEHVAQVLEATWLLKGNDEGIALAEKVAAMPSPGAQFWGTYTKLCAQCASHNANKNVAQKERQAVSRIFERAVLVHGNKVLIWLQWIRFLEAAGGDESVLVTQRAVAALPARAADQLTLQLREM